MDCEITKMTQSEMLLSVLQLILRSGVCPETKPNEWLRTLLYMHTRGFLYVGLENDKIAVVVGAYRIPDITDNYTDRVPDTDRGSILYIPFMASFAEDKLLPKRMLSEYLDKYPEVTEIAFYERNSDEKFKRIARKNYVEEESACSAADK